MAMPARCVLLCLTSEYALFSIRTFNLSGSVERYQWCQTSGVSGPFKSCTLLLRIGCKHKAICSSNGFLKVKKIVVPDAKMRFCLVNSKHIKFPNKHPAAIVSQTPRQPYSFIASQYRVNCVSWSRRLDFRALLKYVFQLCSTLVFFRETNFHQLRVPSKLTPF